MVPPSHGHGPRNETTLQQLHLPLPPRYSPLYALPSDPEGFHALPLNCPIYGSDQRRAGDKDRKRELSGTRCGFEEPRGAGIVDGMVVNARWSRGFQIL